jgi:pimeloyl-ACP methyl ester carboxylesterase
MDFILRAYLQEPDLIYRHLAKLSSHCMESIELLGMSPLIPTGKDENIVEERIDAGFGPILVARQGKFKPNSRQCCIVTFHDLGLNYSSNFQAFLNYHLMRPVIERMPVVHINAPGQEDDADELPSDYVYPTMSQLAESVRTVCNYYNIKQVICFGVGLGANVMARVAQKNPDIVDGVFLINPVPTVASWMEWVYQKRNIYYLNSLCNGTMQMNGPNHVESFPQCILDYLIWHHFGTPSEEHCRDLINIYKNYFSSYKIRPKNLAMLIDSYIRRDDVGVSRNDGDHIECSSLVLCGNDSPFLEDSINMNQRLKPDRSTWMKLFDSGLVLDEQPNKVAEAFILFVQGLGLGLLTCYKYK